MIIKTENNAHSHILKRSASKRTWVRRIFDARALLALMLLSCLLPGPPMIVQNSVMAAGGDIVSTFGTNGVVFTDFAGGNDTANAVTVTRLGKIIGAGSATIPGNGTDFALASYDGNGNLEMSFGVDGRVTTDFFGANDGARDVGIQSDGKIVASGFATEGTARKFAVVRYLENGVLDQSYGQGGKVVLNLGTTSEAFKLDIQDDNKIVVVGDSRVQNNLDFTLIRLNLDGSLDSSFGNNGVARVDFGFTDRAIDVVIDDQADLIFTTGIVVKTQTNSDFGIASLNMDGSLNNDFGGDGTVTLDYAGKQDGGQVIKLREPFPPANERHLLIGGFVTAEDQETSDFGVAALDYIGSQVSFLANLTPHDFKGGRDLCFDLLPQSDGDFVAAGWAGTGTGFDLGMVKYDRKGHLDRGFGLKGEYTLDTASGANNVTFDVTGYNGGIISAGVSFNPITGNDDWLISQHENEKPFEMVKKISSNPVVIGDIITYTFEIKNFTDKELDFILSDSLPDQLRFDRDLNTGWFQTIEDIILRQVQRRLSVPGGQTQIISLRLRVTSGGTVSNFAIIYDEDIDYLGTAEVKTQAKVPELTDVTQQGKHLRLNGVFGFSTGGDQLKANGLHSVEPQASCPVVLVDGVEQKTSRDPNNPTTVLIAKKAWKKIAPGQTVMVKVRQCDNTETATLPYTRSQ